MPQRLGADALGERLLILDLRPVVVACVYLLDKLLERRAYGLREYIAMFLPIRWRSLDECHSSLSLVSGTKLSKTFQFDKGWNVLECFDHL